jgi:hypothetical protein
MTTPAQSTLAAAPPPLVRQPQHDVPGKGLGRQYSADPRDRKYMLTEARLRTVPRGTTLRRRIRPWGVGPILNQGSTNQCTVYAAVQQIQSAPRFSDLKLTMEQLAAIYREALKTDEFQGEADEGTSERAVQKILCDSETLRRVLVSTSGTFPAKAYNKEFLWVPDEDMAKEYLVTRAMLLQGTDWFSGLDTPDRRGYVEPTGALRGGHEYVLRWYYGPRHYKYPDTYEFVQSWGAGHGDRGLFRMKAEAWRYLVWQLNGDLISAIEVQ